MGTCDWLYDLGGFYGSKNTLASAGGNQEVFYLNNYFVIAWNEVSTEGKTRNRITTVRMSSTSFVRWVVCF